MERLALHLIVRDNSVNWGGALFSLNQRLLTVMLSLSFNRQAQ